ncbi:S8 family serine peptidase [Streptomyces sp. NPDC094466]|uniref:S8 family serine peptidase n=1 Tax=Streptomyces sp. NPDC094466 TaxID=3366065 RepID=UPI003807E01B
MHLSHPWRGSAVWTAVAVTAAALLTAPLSASASPLPPGSAAKVDSGLAAAVADGGEATFFVVLKDRADLSAAKSKRGHAVKAKAAFKALRTHAADSQKSLTSFLDKEKVGHQDFWIVNAVEVTGDADLVTKIAKRSDVARVVKEQHYELDGVEQSGSGVEETGEPDAATTEWGVSDIRADKVWSQYKDRGEGIVIANIDSGVQYDHPDLVANYRGNNGDGTFSHDYNWYDPTTQCGTEGVPCDNNGHGTHTMGTMAGANGIGVAPGVTWIAAKGCETRSCSDGALLASGQWILAPTDHAGLNPRPELAPNIVNNSWGGGNTTFYQDIIESWNSAGIFEAFAAGNAGNGTTCSTTEAPGAQAPAYGVGAYDADGRIARFSGFGPSLVDGSMKPNISAPGVAVRSAWPGSTYNTIDGTSMATPHVAGAVALLWAASPSLIGDIEKTRTLLNQGARDVEDTHCGGTAEANNVWGEGKLDILASVQRAPQEAANVTGRVTDRSTGTGLADVTVKVANGSETRTVTTGSDGGYRLALLPGTYTFTFTGYGYRDSELTGVGLVDDQKLTQDVSLTAVPQHAVTGTVLDVTGKPLAKATVAVAGTPVAAVTSRADGTFTLPKVAEGSHTLDVTPTAPVLCNGTAAAPLTVDGNEKTTVRLPERADAFGNTCAPATYSWIKGTDKVALSGDEDARTISLPFWVSLYGVDYNSASVTTNGLVNFMSPRLGDYENSALPAADKPDGIAAPFWDDLIIDNRSTVQTATTGKAGKRKFAIVWNNAATVSGSGRATFEAVFDEATGDVTFQYRTVPGKGAGATVGIENQTGTDALQYSFDQAVLTDGSAIRIAQGAK